MTVEKMKAILSSMDELEWRVTQNEEKIKRINDALYSLGGGSQTEPVSGGGENKQEKKINSLISAKMDAEKQINEDCNLRLNVVDAWNKLSKDDKKTLAWWMSQGIKGLEDMFKCSKRTAYNKLNDAVERLVRIYETN